MTCIYYIFFVFVLIIWIRFCFGKVVDGAAMDLGSRQNVYVIYLCFFFRFCVHILDSFLFFIWV